MANRRALPWRTTRDPWAVLVSEVMLQQTQARRVVAPFEGFLARFPSAAACAAASPGDVLAAWDGLGYNRRAVNLRAAAVAVVERHRGVVPDELAALRDLPGVGAYTARAVLAFAFERDTAVVDTNVARVLARAVAGRPLRPAESQTLADALVPPGESWSFNQAMLDLGALCCTARLPGCARCPLRRRCAWWRCGRSVPDPATRTAGTSRPQSPFAGSDRQGRGRLVSALRRHPVPVADLASTAGWPEDRDRARRAADALVAEGLARWGSGGSLRLP